MSADARAELTHVASSYLAGVRDYRGFSSHEGWRHGVAHGADLALQLGLNTALDKPALDELLDAIFAQAAPPGAVFYHYGEPGRLARPLLYIAARGLHDAGDWKRRFAALVDPAPWVTWREAVASDAGLARSHNLKAFLLVAHFEASRSGDAQVQTLAPMLLETLAALP